MNPARRFAAGMTVAAVAILATALPASAHDELIFSDPASDARLDSAPTSITLQFSGTLLTLGDSASGAVVLIVDEDGTDWAVGDPEVLRDTVTVAVAEGMPDAGYQVRWQVVSEDGHPISGVTPFTIGDAEPFVTPTRTTSESAGPSDQTESETGDAWRIVLVAAIGAAIAAAAFALIHFLRRARTATASSTHRDDDANTAL